ncbi:nuclear transport factor 2 family protein [Williamsia maris]|uniref:nuclear transport factor 2 family protein n=1 Tax=Williamsia maris TaxID=72806 RepID=UPI0020A419CA|nr:nuclear transport factor 2 family protein [Williamsia maris]
MSQTTSTNSSDAIADAMRRNVLEVFNTTDDVARRELIEALYDPNAHFYDAEGSVSGYDAIDAKIRTLQLDAPGLTFTIGVEPAVIDDLGRVSWALGPAGGPAVVTGMDVAHVRAGRFTALYTFLDPR